MLVHWIWLSRLSKLTCGEKKQLLQRFRDPEALYAADEHALDTVEGLPPKAVENLLQKDLSESRQIMRECAEKNIHILTYGDGAYPDRLKNIPDPPMVLYYKGVLPDWENAPMIGVVGTRKASGYGLQMAYRMGYQIASCGALVVSGGADGVDTEALSGALKSGSHVVAVLGFGADVVYPAKNRELFAGIEKQGCLLTEYVPGTPAHSWHFPQRNRIISGLSAGVLVVESPEKSGAMITARYAMEQGRDVYAVPGNVDSLTCSGSNGLLRERAMPAFTGWDVVREYEALYPDRLRRFEGKPELAVAQPVVMAQPKPAADKKFVDKEEKSRYSVLNNAHPELTQEQKAVLDCLSDAPCPVETVLAQVSMPAGKVMSILTVLAVKGIVRNHPGGLVSIK